MKKFIWRNYLAAIAFCGASFSHASTSLVGKELATDKNGYPYVSGEFIVTYQEDSGYAAARSAENSQYEEKALTENIALFTLTNSVQTSGVHSLSSLALEEQLKQINSLPYVTSVEPNYIYSTDLVPNDPEFSQQWGMINHGGEGSIADADIDAEIAWDVSTGSEEVIVGVIDTGFDYNHPDLQANIWVNPLEIAGNGIDDDQNGYVDDIHGISTYFGNGDPMDTSRHGTHVSGTIGAVGNNGIGVAGVAWNVKMVGCSFLGPDGRGTTEGAIGCVRYMLDLKTRGTNIRVLNNSWGGGAHSNVLRDLIQELYEADILFVAAAGNDGWDNDNFPQYPASYPLDNVISVASSNQLDELSSFSNFGDQSVDLAAPGSRIISTVPGGEYATFSGTSMATPHVVGATAVLLSLVGESTVDELRELLLTTGDELPELLTRTTSGRRLNLANALATADPTPSYRLLPNPSSLQIKQGEVANFDVFVKSIYGWAGEVDLGISSDRLLATTIDRDQASPGDNVRVSATTSLLTPYGDYELYLDGLSTADDIEQRTEMKLEVIPAQFESLLYEDSPALDIPDSSDVGATAIINVPDNFEMYEIEVTVDISHTWSNDLVIELISPEGTRTVLRNRTGGSSDDVKETYVLSGLRRENGQGDWVLNMFDLAPRDLGVLNYWNVAIKGVFEQNPEASFIAKPLGNAVLFFDLSVDENNGAIVSREWDFGDGNTSSEQFPVHIFAEQGEQTITLVVTDNSGLTSSTTKTFVTE